MGSMQGEPRLGGLHTRYAPAYRLYLISLTYSLMRERLGRAPVGITARLVRDVRVQRLAHALIRALTARNGTDAETRRQRARGGPRKRSH